MVIKAKANASSTGIDPLAVGTSKDYLELVNKLAHPPRSFG